MSEWTDELKSKAVELYKAQDPTPETTSEIIKDVAEQLDKTANGVRIILIKAEAYVKVVTAAASSAAKGAGDKPTRVSKADAVIQLNEAITAAGQVPDDAVISKLTGKAAIYFATLVDTLND